MQTGVKSVGLANWVTTSWATETGRVLLWGSAVAGWCRGFYDSVSPFWPPINLCFGKTGSPKDGFKSTKPSCLVKNRVQSGKFSRPKKINKSCTRMTYPSAVFLFSSLYEHWLLKKLKTVLASKMWILIFLRCVNNICLTCWILYGPAWFGQYLTCHAWSWKAREHGHLQRCDQLCHISPISPKADAVCTFIERKQTHQVLHQVPLTAHQRLICKTRGLGWVGKCSIKTLRLQEQRTLCCLIIYPYWKPSKDNRQAFWEADDPLLHCSFYSPLHLNTHRGGQKTRKRTSNFNHKQWPCATWNLRCE